MSEDLVQRCLHEWKLQELSSIFEANKIDDELFINLTPDNIREMLPDEIPMGTRWKFIRKYQEFKDGLVLLTTESEQLQTPTTCRPTSVADYDFTFESNPGSPEVIAIQSINGSEVGAEIEESAAAISEPGELETRRVGRKRPQVDVSSIASKKAASCRAVQEVLDLDIAALLKSSLEGQTVLMSHEKNGHLEEDDRCTLTDIVAKWLLFRIQDPKRVEYAALKDKILHLFPNEENVYYIPPRQEGRRQILARGKLFDKVRNLKDWMRKKGLLPSVRDKKSADISTVPGLSIEMTPEVDLALKWLKAYREPWNKVEEKWAITSQYRLDQLRNNPEGSVATYTQEYKHLCQSNGYTLIEIDFKIDQKDHKEETFLGNLEPFCSKLCKILETPNSVKDPDGKQILTCLAKCTTEDSKNLTIMRCLPSLVIPSRLIKIGQKRVKPSVQESRDAFIMHVKTASELQPAMAKRREDTAKQFGAGATVQPYIAFVGLDSSCIDAIYVVIDLFLYKFDSMIQALDICFKSFFALHAKYPPQAEHVWLVIQKSLYGISTEHDANVNNVTSFLVKLQAMSSSSPS